MFGRNEWRKIIRDTRTGLPTWAEGKFQTLEAAAGDFAAGCVDAMLCKLASAANPGRLQKL